MTLFVRFYGLADFERQEVVEFYVSRSAAERALEDALADEPDWRSSLGLVAVEFGGYESGIEVLRAPVPQSWG